MKTSPLDSTAPNARGPLTVRTLTDARERQRFDALLEVEHFLGPRFPANNRNQRGRTGLAEGGE